ncbi:hypothetical protein E2C01_097837 [Portunus trituberculatus]|uniref:Uncharacterized protein n=1 Tax=Portunus trituberculatus TaxID=210409 RepID=A0A5B7K6R1_PORTR|nr:hypothetical protein [Portunus trituberculatus]
MFFYIYTRGTSFLSSPLLLSTFTLYSTLIRSFIYFRSQTQQDSISFRLCQRGREFSPRGRLYVDWLRGEPIKGQGLGLDVTAWLPEEEEEEGEKEEHKGEEVEEEKEEEKEEENEDENKNIEEEEEEKEDDDDDDDDEEEEDEKRKTKTTKM